MSALSWATEGVLGCSSVVSGMAYDGFICVELPLEEGGSGGRWQPYPGEFWQAIEAQVKDAYVNRQRDEFGKRAEDSAAKILREFDREIVKAKVKDFKAVGIKAPEARAMLKERIQIEVDYQSEKRKAELNEEAIAMIMITIGADE